MWWKKFNVASPKKSEKKMDLKKQYEFSLKTLSFTMPISSIVFVIMGIVFCIKFSQIVWVGVIVISTGIMILGLYFALRAYIKRKLEQLEKQSCKK